MGNPSKRVVNRDSTARDHLANERTFLAWIRTGLAVVGLGILLEKASKADAWLDQGLAAALLLFGVALLAFGTFRYQQVREALTDGHFLIGGRSLFYFGIFAMVMALLLGIWAALT